MITAYTSEKMTLECESCQKTIVHDLKNNFQEIKFNEEHQKYESYNIECPNCGSVILLNTNFPLDTEEDESHLPGKQKKDRQFLRYFLQQYRK